MKYFWILFCASIMIFAQNCGDFSSQGSDSESLLSLQGETDRVPFQMLTKKQALSSMVTVAGLGAPDQNLQALYNKLSPVLSDKPNMSLYNSPRAIIYSNISSEVCRQLMDQEKQEKNKRLIRYGLPVEIQDITQQDIDETIRSLARSFWSRNETSQEKDMINESLSEYKALREVASLKPTEQAERQTIFLCTAMLSISDAITF